MIDCKGFHVAYAYIHIICLHLQLFTLQNDHHRMHEACPIPSWINFSFIFQKMRQWKYQFILILDWCVLCVCVSLYVSIQWNIINLFPLIFNSQYVYFLCGFHVFHHTMSSCTFRTAIQYWWAWREIARIYGVGQPHTFIIFMCSVNFYFLLNLSV